MDKFPKFDVFLFRDCHPGQILSVQIPVDILAICPFALKFIKQSNDIFDPEIYYNWHFPRLK